ncbi:hypothetical protein Tco_0807502 [Tanacetum coccineum]
MSSITAQQAKLDLEPVPKEKRLEIGKCNGRLNLGKKPREPTFQVILDALALTYATLHFSSLFKLDKKKRFKLMLEVFRDIFKICPRESIWKDNCLDKLRLFRAQILWGMYHQKNVDYVELLWEDFIYQIDNKAYKKQEKMYYPRFTKVIIHYFLTQDKTVSWRNKIGMYTSRDDYLINTLRFVSAKEATQIYGDILPESKFKKASPTKKDINLNLVLVDEEPVKKAKRVKRPAKKSTTTSTSGIVIRDAPTETKSKRKEKFKEVRKKSLRDFYRTYPSGSGAAKIKPFITNEGTGNKPGVPDVTEDQSSESKAESWGRDEDDSNNDHESSNEGSEHENDSDDENTQFDNEKGLDSEQDTDENESSSGSDQRENEEEVKDDDEEEDKFVKTPSNDIPTDDDDEIKITDKAEGDEDEEIDYTTSRLYDDVDIHLNKPVQADDETVQKEGIDAELTNVQQGNENPEISQVIEDATLSIVPQKTEVPVSSSSHSSDLAAKFLKFLDIHTTEAEIVSLMDVPVYHEVPRIFTTNIQQLLQSFTPPPLLSSPTRPPTTEAINPPSTLPDFALVFQFNNRVTTLEKEVVELKKDPLHTQVTTLVDDHLYARLGATKDEFMNFLSTSPTTRITEQVKNQMP